MLGSQQLFLSLVYTEVRLHQGSSSNRMATLAPVCFCQGLQGGNWKVSPFVFCCFPTSLCSGTSLIKAETWQNSGTCLFWPCFWEPVAALTQHGLESPRYRALFSMWGIKHIKALSFTHAHTHTRAQHPGLILTGHREEPWVLQCILCPPEHINNFFPLLNKAILGDVSNIDAELACPLMYVVVVVVHTWINTST